MEPTVAKDMRSRFGPIRDQGSRPTCLAFAASDAHASLRDSWLPLSCEFAFFHAQRRGGRGLTVGSTIAGMTEAIRDDGQPNEGEWPYSPKLPVDLSRWTPPPTISTVYRRASSINSDNIDAIFGYMDNSCPVILAMMLADSFFLPADHGIIDNISGQPTNDSRRHAVIAVGYGTIGKQRAILIRNSWGPYWGIDGYAWLTEQFLEPRLFKLILMKENIDAPLDRAAA
jgi:C1A family cysteine protease